MEVMVLEVMVEVIEVVEMEAMAGDLVEVV